jgi:hypothetical protein
MKYARDNLFSPEEFSANFGVKTSTLADWRSQGKGARYFKAGRIVWYPKDDADLWVESQIVETNNGTTREPANSSADSQIKETNNATQKQGRDLALEVQAGRPRVQRQHRLGRHELKRDSSARN